MGFTPGLAQLVRDSVLSKLWFTSQPWLQSLTQDFHMPRGRQNVKKKVKNPYHKGAYNIMVVIKIETFNI